MKILPFLCVIALALGCIKDSRPVHCQTSSPATKGSARLHDLVELWDSNNRKYFANRLPIGQSIVLDWSETKDGYMATTMKDSGFRFHVAFNPVFVVADRDVLLLMLHEQCHVLTYDYVEPPFDGHGLSWRECMISLDKQDAFRYILIDRYDPKEYKKKESK